MAIPAQRQFCSFGTTKDDLDDLCRKDMELPAQEFAIGCGFLHQVALGNRSKLELILSELPTLVNFWDYDCWMALHVAASKVHVKICQFLVQNGARIN
jgi:hypothetical protein